ncbi:hypothetical protein [Oxalobacter formigenes]|uniref:hypothetical protein n=1 Tax=Oxalobacter formigenes TaxID=847 RepID=UPI00241E5F53|nr:hypothetical protein [Oxalobacter formigenes]
MTTSNLSNINFMSLVQYNALETKNSNEIYNVKCAVVVDYYNDGTNWYRQWSDGWVEQGGEIVSNNSSQVYTFLVPYSDTTYAITMSQLASNVGTASNGQIIERTNAQSFTAKFPSGSANINFCWFACGH